MYNNDLFNFVSCHDKNAVNPKLDRLLFVNKFIGFIEILNSSGFCQKLLQMVLIIQSVMYFPVAKIMSNCIIDCHSMKIKKMENAQRFGTNFSFS